MLSLEQIRTMSSKAARIAKRRGIEPLIITSHNLARIKAGYGPKIPFIGDYVPEGFYLLEELFVDASGWGTLNEPAMTYQGFIDQLEIGKAYAVREAGEFQVYIGVYGVNGDRHV